VIRVALTAGVSNRIVSARNRFEAALRTSESQLRATWEHAPLGTVLLNRAGGVERINPAFERLLGYSRAACMGMSFSEFNDPDDAEAERLRFADLISGSEPFNRREQRYRRQDCTLLWGRVTVSAIRGAGGVATGALAVLEDITAQRQAELDLRASEEKLRQSQKMEAVGRLVAGVAHNFNNLLAVTMGYTDLLLTRHSEPGVDLDDLQEIRKATERGATLTRQLLAFGRKHDAKRSRIDLNRTVEGIREMLLRVTRVYIQLTIDVASEPLAIVIDPHDLEQVVLNLVINARDALPAGGAIHIDVARESPTAAPGGPPDLPVTPGAYARLRVRDNGIGMTPDVQSHLFEPYFTTKEVGKWTGLCLAFVHGISRQAAGFVAIDSAPAQGTTVSVYFPLAAEAVTPTTTSPPRSSPNPPSRGATILLVEDEAPVSTMMATMLNRAGYPVLSAATPGEACVLFDEHVNEIDLLVTDVVMPEMNGPALAQRLITRRPDLCVLFVSGYSDAPPAGAATGRVAYLAKPFSSHDLVKAIGELLTTRVSELPVVGSEAKA
jgi:PAS domain S-box-containing protein